MTSKKAYALFKKGKLTGCYFARSKAVRIVDEHLGNGLFSPEWEGDKKGEYEIVPCSVAYGKLYVLPRRNGKPKLFSSMDELLNLLKEGGVRVEKKKLHPTTFELETDRGPLKGKIIQVK